ncbi:MAG: putative formate dehydrogenase [bacterium ADurb.Bin363]|nr:MAG: putative formate dehydrogenase [bacterium ADurb.Bin363]
MELKKMIIDEREVFFEEGKTVLQVARENDIYIPSLCYHRKTGPAGRCRVCLVEVEGMRGLQTSCSLPAKEDMEVKTHTEEIIEAQKLFINLLLADGHHNCLSCEANGECELQQACYHLGIEVPAFQVDSLKEDYDDSGEMIRRDPNKCIHCGRCIDACNSVVVNEVLDFGYRGRDVKVICDNDLPMGDSQCVQCGECSQLCPVGAIIDKKSIGKGRTWELEKINTTCPYCGVGCQLTAYVDKKKNHIVKITGREVPPNDGMLCVKGRYGYEFVSHPDRLKYPMIKKDGKHVRVSWDEAIDYTAERIKTIIKRDGPDVFSAFGSGRITNESNYAIMKFTRAVIKTNNVDHCART